jgi:hypothetical protein
MTESTNQTSNRAGSAQQLFRTVLSRGSLFSLAVAALGGGIGFLVVGQKGLFGGLIGAALALVFSSLTALSVLFGAKLPLGGFFGLVLGGWILKLVIFMALIVGLKGATWLDGKTLFFALVASIVGTLTIDSLAVLRARIPVVE